jgi:hypothetical protein
MAITLQPNPPYEGIIMHLLNLLSLDNQYNYCQSDNLKGKKNKCSCISKKLNLNCSHQTLKWEPNKISIVQPERSRDTRRN